MRLRKMERIKFGSDINYKVTEYEVELTREEQENEIWKSLDFDGFDDYEVSNFGRIRNNYQASNYYQGRILAQKENVKGQFIVKLFDCYKCHRYFTVDYLVAMTFLENREGFTRIMHIDGNKGNCKVCNLEWY